MKPPALLQAFADWTLRHKRVTRPVFLLVLLASLSVFFLFSVRIGLRLARGGSVGACGTSCDGCSAPARRAAFPKIPKPPVIPPAR